jgi:hypothetical protein
MPTPDLPPTHVGVTELSDPPFTDERVRLAAAAFRRSERRTAASAAGTAEPAMVELFLIVSGYLSYGGFFPDDGERQVA